MRMDSCERERYTSLPKTLFESRLKLGTLWTKRSNIRSYLSLFGMEQKAINIVAHSSSSVQPWLERCLLGWPTESKDGPGVQMEAGWCIMYGWKVFFLWGSWGPGRRWTDWPSRTVTHSPPPPPPFLWDCEQPPWPWPCPALLANTPRRPSLCWNIHFDTSRLWFCTK